MVRSFTALALVSLVACGEVPTAAPGSDVEPSFSSHGQAPAAAIFRVTLDELNDSGVKGSATLQVRGGELIVTLNAVGHVAERIHPQHIHGFTDRASACPTAAQDTDGNGVITIAEGAAVFGGVQVNLLPYPTPANAAGAIHYTRAFDLAGVPFAPADLPSKTMVLHGSFVDGAYVASLPVACGTVQAVN